MYKSTLLTIHCSYAIIIQTDSEEIFDSDMKLRKCFTVRLVARLYMVFSRQCYKTYLIHLCSIQLLSNYEKHV